MVMSPALRRPLEIIPGNRFRNLEPRLAFLVELDVHRPRQVFRIVLNEPGFQAKPLQLPLSFVSQRVDCWATGNDAGIAPRGL